MTVAVLPASFDPITCGHVDIAARAARLFDRLLIGVYATPRKNVMFSLDERVQMVKESLAALENVEVMPFHGLVVDFAREVGATVVVRGLRTVSDFESECQQATLNRRMAPELEVISLFTAAELGAVSSSMVKEIAENGGDVGGLVPPPVALRLERRYVHASPSPSPGG